MVLSVKHKFESLKVDGGDTSVIRPSNWNEDHDIVGKAWSLPFRNADTAGDMVDIAIGEGLFYDTTAGKLDINLTGLAGFFFMQTPPTGWIKANAAQVSRTTYANLFAKIGTLYGAGNGTTTFTLPDIRGLFPRAWDDARGMDPSRVFGSYQADQVTLHGHTASSGNVSNDHEHAFSGTTGTESVFHSHGIFGLAQTNLAHDSSGEGDYSVQPSLNQNSGNQSQLHVHPFSGVTGGINQNHNHPITVNNAGGDGRPKNLALLGCIKY